MSPPPPAAGSARNSAPSLFEDIWSGALDPSYARAAAGSTPPAAGRWPTMIVLALVGVVFAITIREVHHDLAGQAGSRTALLSQANSGRRGVSDLEKQVVILRGQLDRAQRADLAQTEAGRALQGRIQALQQADARTAVRGAGVSVRLADPRSTTAPGQSDTRVTDTDLQNVVNALWAAGASAISVNNQRLGPATAIRTAGETVLVNFQPVTSPYVIAALGPQDALQTGLADSAAGQRIQTLSSVYGTAVQITAARDLHLPAAGSDGVRLAQPLAEGARP